MSRQRRRRRYTQSYSGDYRSVELPGPLRHLTNPKLFAVIALLFAGAIVFSLAPNLVGSRSDGTGPVRQSGELEDRPMQTPLADGTPQPSSVPTPAVKRYEAPPPVVIDTGKKYVAVIKTAKGDITIELDASAAPESVNSFVFLAREGYYDNTPFMQLATNADGSRFVAQAGDPTRTGLGTPGYFIKKEVTSAAFSRGAVGMGGSSASSNGGQFFISFGDYPALKDKYTIFGRVISGMEVLERLSLLDLTKRPAGGAGDTILAIEIRES